MSGGSVAGRSGVDHRRPGVVPGRARARRSGRRLRRRRSRRRRSRCPCASTVHGGAARSRNVSLPFPGIACLRRGRGRLAGDPGRAGRGRSAAEAAADAARPDADGAGRRRPGSPRARCRGWRPGSASPASSCCCRSPRPTRCRWTSSSARREVGDPRVRLSRETRNGRIVVPADPAVRAACTVWKVVIPPEQRARAPDPRGLRVAVRARRRAAADPRRARHHDAAPGEVAEFDTRLPHWFGPAGDEPVEILSVLGRHGERMHVRAAPAITRPGAERCAHRAGRRRR